MTLRVAGFLLIRLCGKDVIETRGVERRRIDRRGLRDFFLGCGSWRFLTLFRARREGESGDADTENLAQDVFPSLFQAAV
jgi:hypothetical protein